FLRLRGDRRPCNPAHDRLPIAVTVSRHSYNDVAAGAARRGFVPASARRVASAPSRTREERYPPIADYGLIGDCHSLALVSRRGSIDWCCMPRLDSPSCFGRVLDWNQGGCFSIAPSGEGWQSERRYVGDSLVLETRFRTTTGEARLVDAFAMRSGGREAPRHQLLRVVEGIGGEVELEVLPRFEYGAAKPWIRRHGEGFFTAIGGNSGLVVSTDLALEAEASHG